MAPERLWERLVPPKGRTREIPYLALILHINREAFIMARIFMSSETYAAPGDDGEASSFIYDGSVAKPNRRTLGPPRELSIG